MMSFSVVRRRIGDDPAWMGFVDLIEPLTDDEQGRGCRLDDARWDQIERFCASAMKVGANQTQLCNYLRASRSRVSRWCRAGLKQHGSTTDSRFLNFRKDTSPKTRTQLMWARMEVGKRDECWPWRGAIKPTGYGALNIDGVAYQAHRLVYEELVGPISDDLVIDHKCQNKTCVNPDHLQLATQSLNLTLVGVRR